VIVSPDTNSTKLPASPVTSVGEKNSPSSAAPSPLGATSPSSAAAVMTAVVALMMADAKASATALTLDDVVSVG